MSEIKQENVTNSVEKRLPCGTPSLIGKNKGSAFKEYQSPHSSLKKTPKLSTEKGKKGWLGVSESPLCKDLFQRFQQVDSGAHNPKASYDICSPKSHNKGDDNMTPVKYEILSDNLNNEFQLKNSSAEKGLKQIDFNYTDNLLSKSSSSKKHTLKSIIQREELSEEEGLKRRLFGNKPFQSDSYEKSPIADKNGPYCSPPGPYIPQYIPQVIYKSHKYKQASFPYMIPFWNKWNLPPILPIHPDFEIEMLPPAMPSQVHHATPVVEREQMTPITPITNPTTPMIKPKQRQRKSKKPAVDENGKKIIRRRKRKTYEQLQILIKEFQANPEWSKDNMQEVSEKTGLSEAQVYKWGWDQKRKMNDPTHDIHDELRMYKKHMEEDTAKKSACSKITLPSSSKKKHLNESTGKFLIKTTGTPSWDKENVNYENRKNHPETRGVKRKLKALQVKNREMTA